MQEVTFSDSDVGKRVVDSRGEEIGMVAAVREGVAYINPEPGVFDKLQAKLGWEDQDEETYPLRTGHVDRITDDEIHLGRL
ncbi:MULTISPECIES: PRC-barrel domain containing protein [unclassified Haladaptatus]|uniref:PRC-barrel domain containing protein n=1 Tax=unclassified Haladaptatus TaxID=2622732 RepID=UPI0023E7EAD1|nr:MULTISPECIES: PRC-barrel domain containing protein [unclassified Haladaptatus]